MSPTVRKLTAPPAPIDSVTSRSPELSTRLSPPDKEDNVPRLANWFVAASSTKSPDTKSALKMPTFTDVPGCCVTLPEILVKVSPVDAVVLPSVTSSAFRTVTVGAIKVPRPKSMVPVPKPSSVALLPCTDLPLANTMPSPTRCNGPDALDTLLLILSAPPACTYKLPVVLPTMPVMPSTVPMLIAVLLRTSKLPA